MCNENKHDFIPLSVSDARYTYKDASCGFGVRIHYNPASIVCRKCGFVKHVKANETKVQN